MLEPIYDQLKSLNPFYKENFLHGIFSWQELENLLNLRPFVNATRLNIINDKNYNWDEVNWLTDKNTWPADLLQEILKDKMAYLRDCSRVNKKINQIALELETVLDKSVDTHIFFTTNVNDTKGFGIHNDLSHNLIIQVEGFTNFKVWEEPEKTEKRFIDFLIHDPIIDVEMKPGDAIFIPVKCWHSATSKTKRLSLSFPISIGKNEIKQTRKWLDINSMVKEPYFHLEPTW
jgi:hypothetical protein